MERIAFNKLPAGFYAALNHVQNYVDNCGLDFTLLELVRLRVSQLNGCAFCLDMHSKDALNHGESFQRLISVSAWRETPYYTPQEQAALAFAERLTVINNLEDNDDIHEELNQYFSKDEIANLTLAIIQINSWNRLVKSIGPVPGNYQPAKLQEA